jgi:S-adenosylhomocysteine hydrolase
MRCRADRAVARRATGRTSLRADHLDALRGDCYLASVTSRARELALDEIADDATAIASPDGLRYQLPTGATVTVVADGYPLNFHHAESLPNSYADVVMAALALGAVALSAHRDRYPAGHNVALTDQVLESSGLLERYYALHGPAT